MRHLVGTGPLATGMDTDLTTHRAVPAARVLAAVAALAVVGTVPFVPQILGDGDTYWHVAAGEWMLSHRAVPHVDPFSATMLGQPWTAHEWLSEVLMALAYRVAGWSGVALLTGACAAAAAAALVRYLRRAAGSTLAAAVLAALACAMALPTLLARPHVLALPLLVVWAAGILRARAEERSPSLLLLPVMALWANMHGGYAAGLALALPLALEAVVAADAAARGRTAARWGGFVAAAVTMAALTPHGIEGLAFPVKLLRMQGLSHVREWRALDFAEPQPFEFFLLAVVAIVAVGRPRLRPVRLLILLGLIHAALGHGRNQTLAGILGAMLLAEPFGGYLMRARGEAGAGAAPVRPRRRWAAACAAAALLLASARLALPVGRSDAVTPQEALLGVPSALLSRPVFNEYSFGGYLIFKGVRPFIDGRTDLYGDAFMEGYAAMTASRGALLSDRLDARGVAWTILSPANAAVAELDGLPGWRRIHTDERAVVHVRRDAMPEYAAEH